MISASWFTLGDGELIDRYFNGNRYKPSQNGVYLVAHADTVHDVLPTESQVQCLNGVFTAPETGLGADDRGGCYIVSELMRRFPECGYLISSDEESGDSEFMAACPDLETFGAKPLVFISFDRKGTNEYVDYDHWSSAIEEFLEKEGIELKDGSRSTCGRLSAKYKKPCVNLCFGGGRFHRMDEYLDSARMEAMFPLYEALIEFCLNTELDYDGSGAPCVPMAS